MPSPPDIAGLQREIEDLKQRIAVLEGFITVLQALKSYSDTTPHVPHCPWTSIICKPNG